MIQDLDLDSLTRPCQSRVIVIVLFFLWTLVTGHCARGPCPWVLGVLVCP